MSVPRGCVCIMGILGGLRWAMPRCAKGEDNQYINQDNSQESSAPYGYPGNTPYGYPGSKRKLASSSASSREAPNVHDSS